MLPVYTATDLSAKPISELKTIARQVGAAVVGDLRRKATFVDAIIGYQQAAVELVEQIAAEAVAEHEAQIAAEADEEVALRTQMDRVGNAVQAAIAAGDREEAHRLDDELDSLIQQYEELIEAKTQALAPELADPIWWYDSHNGTVTVEGQKRQFKVVHLYSDCPVVQVFSSTGKWIDSRWFSARNNRYINTVLAAIPARIDAMHERILKSDPFPENDGELWDGQTFLGHEEDRPPGKGDGRGRIEPVNEWVEF